MRETGMDLAIEEAGAGPLPDRVLFLRGAMGFLLCLSALFFRPSGR